MLPPAHKVVAQACDSTGSPEHVPPFSEWVVISLARNWTDPPHVTAQLDHDDHEPQTQFTRRDIKWNLSISNKMFKFNDGYWKIHICYNEKLTSWAASCATSLLFSGNATACRTTIFLVSIYLSCPYLNSTSTCYRTCSPSVPWSPNTIHYIWIIWWYKQIFINL